jgi:hypothetical protein
VHSFSEAKSEIDRVAESIRVYFNSEHRDGNGVVGHERTCKGVCINGLLLKFLKPVGTIRTSTDGRLFERYPLLEPRSYVYICFWEMRNLV